MAAGGRRVQSFHKTGEGRTAGGGQLEDRGRCEADTDSGSTESGGEQGGGAKIGQNRYFDEKQDVCAKGNVRGRATGPDFLHRYDQEIGGSGGLSASLQGKPLSQVADNLAVNEKPASLIEEKAQK